jgi:DNA-3-methyladenine glycosylase
MAKITKTRGSVASSIAAAQFDPSNFECIARDFFDRDPRQVAPDLLGKVLLRREGDSFLAGKIVETEAYLGADDAAAHSAAGKTPRNAVLFGPPGYAYVYLIYGNHFCLNVSCLPAGNAGCVLIRALEPLAGIAEMARLRGLANSQPRRPPSQCHSEERSDEEPAFRRTLRLLCSGPGRLAQALGITRPRDNGKDLLNPGSDLQIVDIGFAPSRIATTPRVGITKAADHPLRYVIAGNAFVSGKRVR